MRQKPCAIGRRCDIFIRKRRRKFYCAVLGAMIEEAPSVAGRAIPACSLSGSPIIPAGPATIHDPGASDRKRSWPVRL